jgi:protein-disulfide isomerase
VVAFLLVVLAAELLPGESPVGAAPGPGNAKPGTSAGAHEGGAQEQGFVRRDADDPMAIGDVDAPVVLTEWLDLRCPYCAVFSRDTLPSLVRDYVDTGRVRIEFHDVAFFGEQSEDAAVAARAAGNQGKFVEYVTAVYDAAPARGHADLPRARLVEFAEEVGVPDVARFTADLDDLDVRAEAQASTRSAQQIGVSAVPFFVAGGTALSGAQPEETFREFLDQALAEVE